MDLPEFNLDQMVRLLGDKDITIARLQILVAVSYTHLTLPTNREV